METTGINQSNPANPLHPAHVHHVLARSYSVYFLLFLAGVTLDLIFDLEIFTGVLPAVLGLLLLGLGTILIMWAQNTSRRLHKDEVTKESFLKGPYCYTRSPTHWGLFFLMLGFGLVINALFVAISSVLAFVITKLVYIKRQEDALARKYGAPYLEYKKLVKI